MLKITLEDMGEEREYGPYQRIVLDRYTAYVICEVDNETMVYNILRDESGNYYDELDGSYWRSMTISEWSVE